MAKLYVTEYDRLGTDFFGGRSMAVPQEPSVDTQTPVVIGAGSLQSAAFNAATGFVMIHTDAICSIKFGTNPTATADNQRLAAGDTRFYAVPKGASYKVAVITNS